MSVHVESEGSGPDLVLIHGWGLHSGVWSEVLPALAARNTVHSIDLPGHGYSAAVPVNRFDQAVDEVAAVIPDGSIVCGWSLGGLVAQRMARRHPNKVRKLALVSTTPCFVERSDWPHAMKASTLETFATGLHADRAATLESFVRLNALNGTHGREAIRAFTRRLFDRGAPSEAALATSLDWLRTTDVRLDSARPGAPTLVIHGTRDALAPIEAGRWLAETIPGAQLLEIPGAAHIPFFTHRAAFLGALESFLG